MSHVRWTVFSLIGTMVLRLHEMEAGLKCTQIWCEDGKTLIVSLGAYDALLPSSVPQIPVFTAVFIIIGRQEISMKETRQHVEEERQAYYEQENDWIILQLCCWCALLTILHWEDRGCTYTLCTDFGLGKLPQNPVRQKPQHIISTWMFDSSAIPFFLWITSWYCKPLRRTDRRDNKDAPLYCELWTVWRLWCDSWDNVSQQSKHWTKLNRVVLTLHICSLSKDLSPAPWQKHC